MKKFDEEFKEYVERGAEKFGYVVSWFDGDETFEPEFFIRPAAPFSHLPMIEFMDVIFENERKRVYNPKIRLEDYAKSVDDMISYIEKCREIAEWIKSISVRYEALPE